MPTQTVAAAPMAKASWVEVEQCPICSAAEHRPFEAAADRGRKLRYRICWNCGAVFQSPRMSEQALEAYYRTDYAAQHQRASEVTQKELGVQAGRARHLVRLLQGSVRAVKRHLDVGSSTGTLLTAATQQYGCQSIGIEPAELYRRYSSGMGQTVYPSLQELAGEDASRFDLVTLAHVLEHLPEPAQYLREIRRTWLESDGHLLIEVPNLFGHRSYEVPHLLAFHAIMLRRTLHEAGLATIWLRRHGVPRSKLIPLYLTALATPKADGGVSAPPRRSASRVRVDRSIGMAWHQLATRFAPRWAWLPFPEPLAGPPGGPEAEQA